MEKIAFLFPGQGSQYLGMGKALADEYAVVRHTFEEASDLLGYDLAEICFEGSYSDLADSAIAQPALLTTSISAFRAYMQEIGVKPDFAAGHSLGEYAALTASGALTFKDALLLVKLRGELTQQLINNGNGRMTIVDGVHESIVEQECLSVDPSGTHVSVSCRNGPEQTAISGEEDAISRVELNLQELGSLTPLFKSAPFHSSLMTEVADQFTESLHSVNYSRLGWPVISNVTGLPYPDEHSVADLLIRQITHPVRWSDTMSFLSKQRVSLTVESGPKNVLTALVEANVPKGINVFCFDSRFDRQNLAQHLNLQGDFI
ncbi:ACP S-malonyltransferase [Paenibacillus sp. HJL G12]|uniref:Malonyl CoA-acyl carrier protein transacylase n=1 Tax=Paenibacillus dendrobii TaxID=2691084 RepID=A0A7X3IIN7_9BACL|nr:ACP S-malonyltransferase [Paenibacillus dendrobii]MWV44652.1 ACP S-malonyltransferase [Paenibacillus dendrobii]